MELGLAMMEFNPDVIEIFTDMFSGKTKYRLCVGFVVGEHLYCMQKLGVIDWEPDVVHPTPRHLDGCRRTYDNILVPGELTMPIYGYDLGEPCEYDDDGERIGEWPQLGAATIRYHDKFLMRSEKLPAGHTHRRPMRWLGS
jgi:hypothetical protein